MSWQPHELNTGLQGSGKTYLGIQRGRQIAGRRPVLLYDMNWDARKDFLDSTDADAGSSATALLRCLRAGENVRFLAGTSKNAPAEVDFLTATLKRAGGGVFVVDEAHVATEQGKVSSALIDDWQRARHYGSGLTFILCTPLAESIDHHLRRSAAYWNLFPLPWSPWMGKRGVTEQDMITLAAMPKHSYLRVGMAQKQFVRAS